MGLASLRRLIVGERLPTERAIHERLPKYLALPVFASDAISSSAYAIEEILLVVVVAGSAGMAYSSGVAAAIAMLFMIVAFSYRQTVLAYPTGGGAYTVARENLGVGPGLVAAAALLTDYVLTVAVSIAAGVAAITSAIPSLAPDRVLLGVFFVALITAANLRGARESGKLFAPPVYLFVAVCLLMVPVGLVRLLLHSPDNVAQIVPPMDVAQPVTLLLLLRAFASGCAALTGIEAISNGVPAFRPPEAKNAATTLAWMAAICVSIFVGLTILTELYHVVPDPSGHETVLSILGRHVFGRGVLYFLLQTATAAILILAANTSFADFPRLSSILARDGFAPRQLANLGDRLVFANGILVLGALSAVLIWRFHGRAHALIPLYAIGVFISFTLSQAGMVKHWLALKTPGWEVKAAINATGAVATAVVLIVVTTAKFTHGAWMVLLIVPILVAGFRKIAVHYRGLSAMLSPEGYAPPRAIRHTVLVLVPGFHRGVLDALAYARTISTDSEAVFVEIDPRDTPALQEHWRRAGLGIPLTVLKSPWRSLAEPIIHYTRTLRAEKHIEMVTVIIPEFVTTHWWHRLLHNQSGLMLKLALMFEPGVVVTNVRYRPRPTPPES
jgi:amino acid transporter